MYGESGCCWSAASIPLSSFSRPSLHPIYFSSVLSSGLQGYPRGVHPASKWEKRGNAKGVPHSWPSFPARYTCHLCSYFIGKATGMATPRCEGGWDRCSRFSATVLHCNKNTSFWWKASCLCHNPLGTHGRNSSIWLVVICAIEFCFHK